MKYLDSQNIKMYMSFNIIKIKVLNYAWWKTNFSLLYGRDSISEFNIYPKILKSVYTIEISSSFYTLEALLNKFSDLYSNKVGEIRGMKTERHLENMLQ